MSHSLIFHALNCTQVNYLTREKISKSVFLLTAISALTLKMLLWFFENEWDVLSQRLKHIL